MLYDNGSTNPQTLIYIFKQVYAGIKAGIHMEIENIEIV